MWLKLSSFLIRFRIYIIFSIVALTVFMAIMAQKVGLSYDFAQIVPQSDPDYAYYQNFQEEFGQDGRVIVLGFEGKDVFNISVLKDWIELQNKILKINGIDTILSINTLFTIEKNPVAKKFRLVPLVPEGIHTQEKADSVKEVLSQLPFYDGLIYNPDRKSTFMAVSMTLNTLRTKGREQFIDDIHRLGEEFSKKQQVEIHYSGLPYLRTMYGKKLQSEMDLFLLVSVLLTGLVLIIVFKDIKSVLFPMIVIGTILVWTVGLMGILGYKLTILTVLIPPLVVIVGIPNFIYFINSYHTEFSKEGNKFKAIHKMVDNIAFVVFMNNVTTAIGFGVMFFVDSPMIKEFGLIAFSMICFTYLAMTILIPIVFSYLPIPKQRHIKYLDNKAMNGLLKKIDFWAQHKSRNVFLVIGIVSIISFYGASQLKSLGYILDDVPKGDKLVTDLTFYEQNFGGIMPWDIVIDTKKKNGLLDLNTLELIKGVQDTIQKAIPEFDKPLSLVEVVKFARQGFYNGNPEKYGLPTSNEQFFLVPYLRKLKMKEGSLSNALVDKDLKKARINFQMTDVGSIRLAEIEKQIQKILSTTLKDSDIEYHSTGYSLLFLKGNKYLIDNLLISLAFAIGIISLVIVVLFKSMRLLLVVLIPNFIALIITAGIMGYFNLNLKPSSVLVFSIAFGIAVDASFHFVVKYKLAVKELKGNVSAALSKTLLETGFSLVSTTIVLFVGFASFCFSHFGSTIALGALTAITLISALFTNIFLIPALVLAIEGKHKKNYNED